MNRIQAVPERRRCSLFFDLERGTEERETGVYAHGGQMGIFTIP